MFVTESTSAVQGSFYDVWNVVMMFVPNILVAAIIFVIGWIVGAILSTIIQQVVKVLRVDDGLRGAGVDKVAQDAGFRLNAGLFLGELVKWFVVLVFLVASLQVLGLTQVNMFLQAVVLTYMPKVIVAVLMLILGALVAHLAQGVVSGSARAAHAPSANFAGKVAKWAVWVVTILAVLDQLGVAPGFVQSVFMGIVVSISLAFGLAFGLGGKDAAARFIERTRSEIE